MGGISDYLTTKKDDYGRIKIVMGGISDHQEGNMRGGADQLLNRLPRPTLASSRFPRNLK